MQNTSILISGIGIGGPTLAYWLKVAGFEPTLVEQAPGLRSGGYVIDFWGLGYDIADRMGLAEAVDRVGYHMRELRIVDDHGRRVTGFGTSVLKELTGGRFVTIGRSDLSHLLFEKAKVGSNIIFDDEIVGLQQFADGVDVQFKSSGHRRFDLVIGADGLHSSVRKHGFGPQSEFETSLGYVFAAFEVSGYRPRDDGIYMLHGEPGRMLGRFTLKEDRVLFLFVYASDRHEATPVHDPERQKAVLRERYRDSKWECARILEELDQVETLYFDRVSQIRMDRWSNGRVALIGDAAFCPSLMAGQGSAMAMTSAYVLAGELAKAEGRHQSAFANYEQLIRPSMETKQRGAERFSSAMAPKTSLGLIVRNLVIRATAIPGVAKLAFGKEMIEALKLPEYPWRNDNAMVWPR